MAKDRFRLYRKIEEEENRGNELSKLMQELKEKTQLESKIPNPIDKSHSNITAQGEDTERDLKERLQRVLEKVTVLEKLLEKHVKSTESEDMRRMLNVALAIYIRASIIDHTELTQRQELIRKLEIATYKLNNVLENHSESVITHFIDNY